MAKQHDENLFDIPVESEDIVMPGEVALRVPKTPESGEDSSGEKTPSELREKMLEGEKPPLLAVDVQEGEKAKPGTITQKKEAAQEKDDEEETKKTETGEKEKPAEKKGQQGSGEGAGDEEKLSPTYLHAAVLHEAGALPNLDLNELKDLESEEILNKIADHTVTQINDQVEAQVKAYKSQFNDEQRRILEMFDSGIHFDDASNVVYNQMRYDSITEEEIKENPELAERVYREFLYVKGHDDDYIDRVVKQAKEMEQLETEGLNSRKQLVQIMKDEEAAMKQDAEEQKREAEQKRKENLEKIRKDVSGTTEILKGVKLSEKDRQEVIRLMTVPAEEIQYQGRKMPISAWEKIRRKDPIGFTKKMAYFVHLGLFDENAQIPEIIEAKGETSAVKKLSGILEGQGKVEGGKPAIKKEDIKKASGKKDEDDDVEIRMPSTISTVQHKE